MSEKPLSRREFVLRAAAGTAALGPISLLGCSTAAEVGTVGGAAGAAGWDRVPGILARIQPPRFPEREFLITAYGAVEGGRASATGAIRQAIAACHAAGGGRVVVPAGRFLTGPIHLTSNVELHVGDGATLLFSRDPGDYLPAVFTRWEGMEMMGYSPLIYAFEAENVAVTGAGTLDGQASQEYWWPWKGRTEYGWREGEAHQQAARDRLMEMVEAGVPVEQRQFGAGSYLRPQFIQPYRCRNVLVEGVTIVSSPMWEIHPVLCQNVTVRGVRVQTHGPNNDGCNPESCRDVLIEDCFFDTGDDCIALKSGRNADGRRLGVPVENVIIRNCRMKEGHGGVTIGSEISGGARNVFAYDCVMDSPNLDRALRFKTNAMRGGVVEHVYMRNVEIGVVGESIVSIDFHYEEGADGPYLPTVRDVHVSEVTSQKSEYGLYLRGFPNAPIRNVRLVDCDFANVEKGNVLEYVEDIRFIDVTINGVPVTPVA